MKIRKLVNYVCVIRGLKLNKTTKYATKNIKLFWISNVDTANVYDTAAICFRAKLFGAMMLSTIATLASFYIFLTAVKFAGSQV
jgi:hypothetical protein